MKGFITAIQFMTRIPIKTEWEISKEEFGQSSKYFPVVGLVIGIILSIIYLTAQKMLPPFVVGAIIIISEILITGGIHLDGFMDTMDGVLSGRPKEKTLEIMKDSRVGAHSVTALFSLLLMKFSIIVTFPVYKAALILIFMPVIGRWYMLYCITFFPYARKEGLGKIFWLQAKKNHWFIYTILLCVMFSLISLKLIFITIITFLIILTPTIKINNFLDGHTGDTYGALCEITEIIFLLSSLIIYT